MFKRSFSIFVSLSAGLLASALVLAFAQHPAGTAWAAPEFKPLTATITLGGDCGPTIQDCIDAANPGDEVHIPAGIYTESLIVAKAISVTGDLSSTTIIHALANQRVMSITSGPVYLANLMLTGGAYSLTLPIPPEQDCGGGLHVELATAALNNVAVQNNAADCGGGLGIYSSTMTLDGVDISHNLGTSSGGGIYSYQSDLTLNSGDIHDNTSVGGGGITAGYGTLTLAGGTIYSNTAETGGGVGQSFTLMLLSGTQIISNRATDGGGVALFGLGSVLTQTGGIIAHNHADNTGGGIALQDSQLTLTGGQIFTNTASLGGGVYVYMAGSVELSGTEIFSNTGDFGGGVWLDGDQTVFTQTAGSIHDNFALTCGGGICSHAGSIALLGGSVTSNSARLGAGVFSLASDPASSAEVLLAGGLVASNTGLYDALGGGLDIEGFNGAPSYFTQTAGSIEHNTAINGGGLRLVNAQAWLLGGDIFSNSAATGAGVYMTDTSLLLDGIAISDNTASNAGGGLYVETGTTTIENSQFIGNAAGSGGGGISNAGVLTVTNTLFAHNTGSTTQIGGGGLAIGGGSAAIRSSTFSDNDAGDGGGVYLFAGDLDITGTAFISNTGSDEGGGIFIDLCHCVINISNSTFVSNSSFNGAGIMADFGMTVTNSTFSDNVATGNGGGLSAAAFDVNILNSNFTGNSANGGGAIEGSDIYLSNTTLVSNTATDAGAIASSHIVIDHSSLLSNVATHDGGAIVAFDFTVISNTTLSGNTAGRRGGAIYANNLFTLTDSSLLSNTAATEGGGLYLTGTVLLVNNSQLISNTSVSNGAGGIYSAGILTVTNSTIRDTLGLGLQNDRGQVLFDSGTLSNNSGGGLLNLGGSALVTGSLVSNNPNTGVGSSDFGNDGASLTVINSQFSGNSNPNVQIGGGAIANIGGNLAVNNSSFISNSAAGAGGGIYNYSSKGATIRHSTFSSNSDGAIFNLGAGAPTTTLSISDSLFANNISSISNAGITNEADRLEIISTTFANNASSSTVYGGGAVYNLSWGLWITSSAFYSNTTTGSAGAVLNSDGPVSIADSTFSDNQAENDAGAIWLADGPATLNNVTIAGNTATHSHSGVGGGGLVVSPGTAATITNTVIAGNNDLGGQAPDCAGTLTTGGHNLIQSAAGCTLSGTASGDITGTAALLGPIQDNGGATWTMALLAGSPAVDAGSQALPGSGGAACEAADQRGVVRPQGTACDIGAFEAVGLSATITAQLSSSAYSAMVSAGSVPITVTLSQTAGVTVTAQYTTSDGTALAGQDYIASGGLITFTPGMTQTTFTIALLSSAPGAPDKAFTVALLSPTLAILGTPATATVTLHNDAPPPTLALASSQFTVTESSGTASLTATLSVASAVTVTAHYATSDGTALAGGDYTAASGTLTFTPGLTQTTFSVSITADTLHENNEAFNVALSNPNGASLGAPVTATVTILDDDPAPAVAFSNSSYTVTESSGTAAVTVTLSAASGLTATVHYATSNGTATAGSDYTPVSGTLTFAPGQVTQVFTVPITNDVLAEGPETVLLALYGPTGASLGSPGSAVLTIVDDDVEYRLYLPLTMRP